MKILEVAAGLICHEGRYLIARRKPGVHLEGLWEFPGGKRESGESFEECLRRELLEELSLRIKAPILFQTVRHDYPGKTVELRFFRCAIDDGVPIPCDCAEIRWAYPHEMMSLQFPPADMPIIMALQEEGAGA